MVISSLSYLLLASALTINKAKTVYYSRVVILSLVVSSLICHSNLYPTDIGKGIGLFGGTFNITVISQSFNIFILLISATILIYNSYYHWTLIKDESISLNKTEIKGLDLKRYNTEIIKMGDSKSEIYKIIEYPLIILFIICGALFLMSSSDLISVFISIELQSYGLYILSTLHRDSEQSTWGGLTYFLLGGLSSCFILLGSALLYINSGTTSLDGIYIINTITDIVPNVEQWNVYTTDMYNIISQLGNTEYNAIHYIINLTNSYYLNISLIILSVGFLFKISAAPFHFWSPEVYDAIPTAVTTYVAIIAKISIFIFLLELVYFMGIDKGNTEGIFFTWKDCLLISSLFSLIIGAVLGLTQFRIKRVYAYSTISHVGFILLALCVNNTESIQAYLFYIITYTISNLNAFIILVTIGYTLYLYILKPEHTKVKGYIEKYSTYNSDDKISVYKSDNSASNTISSNNSNITNKLLLHEIRELNNKRLNLENNNIISYSKTFNVLIDRQHTTNPLKDINNSPIQLVSQLKGYFYINSYLSLSLAITLFSFMGIPPLVGFFAKQMVLSAALDNGYIFITLVGVLTSVIGAVYYLNIVKQMFFYNSDYIINPYINHISYFGGFKNSDNTFTVFNAQDIKLNSFICSVISILTLLLSLFIFIPNESFALTSILSILLFN